nr:hypothetical protein [Micromonospora inositola]
MTGSWFVRVPLGHLEETNGRAPAIQVDDGRVVGLVETGFLDIAEGQRPESSDPLGIVGIASQGPKVATAPTSASYDTLSST